MADQPLIILFIKVPARGQVKTRLAAALGEDVVLELYQAAGFIFTDIERDGMQTGVNVEATARFARCSPVPVIASGGVVNLDDVRRLKPLKEAGIVGDQFKSAQDRMVDAVNKLIERLDALITHLGGPVTDAIENLPGITIPVDFDVQNPDTFTGAFTWVWPQLPLPQAANGGVFTKPTVALIGEAAGWISPSSAEGISYAFRSALALAKALEPGSDNFLHRYLKNTKSLRVNIVLKNLKSPFMYNLLLRKMVHEIRI